MKIITKGYIYLMIVVLTAASAMLFSACGDDDTALSPQDRIKENLTAAEWTLQNVIVDGVDKTSIYEGLKLTFTDVRYSAVDGGQVWPASGVWSFADSEGKTIKRDDGIVVGVEATNTTLKLTLTWDSTTITGRVRSIRGLHTFSFSR